MDQALDLVRNTDADQETGKQDDSRWIDTPLRRFASRWRFVAAVQIIDFLSALLLLNLLLLTTANTSAQTGALLPAIAALLGAVTILCVLLKFQIYDFAILSNPARSMARAGGAGIISVGALLIPLLWQRGISPVQAMRLCVFAAVGLVLLMLSRLVIGYFALAMQRAGVLVRRVYIIAGSRHAADGLVKRVAQGSGNRIAGVAILSKPAAKAEETLGHVISFLQNTPIDVVILSLPLSEADRVVEVARILRTLPQTVLLAPELGPVHDLRCPEIRGGSQGRDGLEGLMAIGLLDRPLSGWRWVLKDVQDRILALILLFVISPVLVCVAVAIKLSDPGPVLFRQERYGYRGETFQILKFRTMRVHQGPIGKGALRLTTRGDARIFPVGKFLRKTSLDELPQLFNVLMGHMWIVGPRPHSPHAIAGGHIYRNAVRDYAARYRIKPGITGWAQVCGWRGPTDSLEQLAKRVEHDLFYIENWSVLFDMQILFRTVLCVFGHENAF